MEQNLIKKEPLGRGYHIYTSSEYRFGTDAVLLANFASPKHRDRCVDLGCGAGIIPLILTRDNSKLDITGVDIQTSACELLKKAAEENGFNNLKVINSNWCELKGKLEFGAYDVVTCNPPYKKAEAGITNENEARRIARHETGTTLSDVCKAAASLLRSGGKFYMCHRPERLCDIICDMRSVNIEPKRIRFVHQRLNTEPWLVLVEGRRDGKSGIRVDNPLYIEWDNEPSKEMEEIYGVYRDGKGSEE